MKTPQKTSRRPRYSRKNVCDEIALLFSAKKAGVLAENTYRRDSVSISLGYPFTAFEPSMVQIGIGEMRKKVYIMAYGRQGQTHRRA